MGEDSDFSLYVWTFYASSSKELLSKLILNPCSVGLPNMDFLFSAWHLMQFLAATFQ